MLIIILTNEKGSRFERTVPKNITGSCGIIERLERRVNKET
jgi:hypothetical protein